METNDSRALREPAPEARGWGDTRTVLRGPLAPLVYALAAALILPSAGTWSGRAIAIATLGVAIVLGTREAPLPLRAARALAIAGAASGVATAFVSPAAWLGLVVALAAVSAMTRPRALAPIWLATTIVPLAFGALLAVLGASSLALALVLPAVPVDPWLAGALTIARAWIAVALFTPSVLGVARAAILALVGSGLALARLAEVASFARLDAELYWPEAPMLTNALKLANGEPLYGAPERLDSYSYSPLLDVVHRALLRPFGVELELFAHRALILADQAAAFLVLAFALGLVGPRPPRPVPLLVRASSLALLLFASYASLIAAAVHPDHPMLVCFAAAIAVAVAEDRMPRALGTALWLLVTPLAAAFKLSGGGIGLGLFAIAVLRRDKRALVLLVVSGVLTVATIPLFGALFGRFTFYAMTLQKSHPMEWRHFLEPPWTSFFAFGGALAVAAVAARPRGARDPALAIFVLTCAMTLLSVPAAAKYAGRDNNFTMLFVGGVAMLVAIATSRERHAAATLGVAVWGALVIRPPHAPVPREARDAVAAETRAIAEVVRRDAARGERTLLLTSVLPWIRAGRTDVPRDRWHSAIELFYGHFPEGDGLRQRIAAGEYATVIGSGSELANRAGPARDFQEGVLTALAARYREERPPGIVNAHVYLRRER